MAGYSGTPLPQKLGIKPGHRVALLGAPEGFSKVLGLLPEGVSVTSSLGGKRTFDVMLLFVLTQKDVVRGFAPAARRLDPAGGLWVAWPKRASGIATDVTENTVRGVMLDAGLVDNKVCAIDDTWSGLRAVVRVVNRPRAAAPPRKARKRA
jgi:hypothetical protein